MPEQGFEGSSKLHEIMKRDKAAAAKARAAGNELAGNLHEEASVRAAIKINEQGVNARDDQ